MPEAPRNEALDGSRFPLWTLGQKPYKESYMIPELAADLEKERQRTNELLEEGRRIENLMEARS